MFSEQTTPIKPYDIPINSEFYGEGPLEVRFPKFFHFLNIVIPGIDWAVSSLLYRYMLVAYTCGGQIAEYHAYTLVAYTCGGRIAYGLAYTLVAYTCGGQIAKRRAEWVWKVASRYTRLIKIFNKN